MRIEAEAQAEATRLAAEAEAAAEEEERKAQDIQPLRAEYLDVIISDVRTRNGLSFSVQILNTEGSLEVSSSRLFGADEVR